MNEHIDVDALARLARLALSEDEKQDFARDLCAMLAFGRTLGEADLSATEGDGETPKTPCVLRADAPMPSLDRDAILGMAATASDGYVTVVRVLSEQDGEGDTL